MWLLSRLTPDFKTIPDFRRDHPAALKRVCREFIVLCRRLDLFGGELLAIHDSKVRAVNARDRRSPHISRPCRRRPRPGAALAPPLPAALDVREAPAIRAESVPCAGPASPRRFAAPG